MGGARTQLWRDATYRRRFESADLNGGWSSSPAREVCPCVAQAPTFLTYDGAGHGTYWLSPCARAAIDTYLVERRTPAKGTHCPAVFPTSPFGAQTVSTNPLVPGLRGVTVG
jgi:hypothetical protein